MERVKTVVDNIGKEGEGGELGLVVLDAGNGGGEVGELEEGGFFEALGHLFGCDYMCDGVGWGEDWGGNSVGGEEEELFIFLFFFFGFFHF